MASYFFDCCDGERYQSDHHGMSLRDDGEARDHAVSLAQSLLVDRLPDREVQVVAVTVRAADGSVVYVAHCSFTGCWTRDRGMPTTPSG